MTTPINRRLQNIPAGQVDFTDSTFRLLPFSNSAALPASLQHSLERVGLLLPPILKEIAPHRYQVVAGWNRLQGAFALLELKQCPCWVLPIDTPDEVVLTHALEAILISRPPSAVERAVFFRKLLANLDPESAARRYLPLFGLEPQQSLISKSLRLLDLEEPLLIALHGGLLLEEAAEALVGLSFPDRFALFDLIDFLEMDASNQKQLIQICRELASRAGRAIIDVLDTPAIKETIHDPLASPAAKTAMLMEQLNELRFPQLSQAEQALRQFAGALKLPAQICLCHEPAAGTNQVSLTIRFPDYQRLSAIWPQLQALLDEEEPPLSLR